MLISMWYMYGVDVQLSILKTLCLWSKKNTVTYFVNGTIMP